MVIWIVGLAGSGKTTLAKALQDKLLDLKKASVVIDGDDMRTIWGEDIDYTLQGRKKNSQRIQKTCAIFEKQNLIVIASIMSIFQEDREENRKIFKQYYEVFLDIDMTILQERREIYKNAKEGKISNVVGVDILYQKPKTYDKVYKNCLDINFMIESIIEDLGLRDV